MKNYLIISLLCLTPLFVQSQSTDYSAGRFGFTVNSSFNGELSPIRIVPSLSYTKGKNQLELGIGLHPFIRDDYKILSVELNQKYFPNGIENKFNLYFISRLSYINNRRDTYYPSTYNYLFLNGGYGFEIKAIANAFIGMNMSAGLFTYSKNTDIPYDSFATEQLFDNFEWNLAFQFNLGYRF